MGRWNRCTSLFNGNKKPLILSNMMKSQGRLRGKTNSELIISGKDKQYERAVETKSFRISYELTGEPLSLRVGRHIQGIKAILDSYNDVSKDKKIIFENIPSYSDLIKNGVETYLK